MSEPASASAIRSYHAHVYFRDSAERELALQLRDWMGKRFSLQLGRVHEMPVGPHSQPMYQVAFACEAFEPFVSWLMLNRAPLSILVHPNTGRGRDDHLVHALWLGERLQIRDEILTNDPDDDPISPVEPNTSPDTRP